MGGLLSAPRVWHLYGALTLLTFFPFSLIAGLLNSSLRWLSQSSSCPVSLPSCYFLLHILFQDQNIVKSSEQYEIRRFLVEFSDPTPSYHFCSALWIFDWVRLVCMCSWVTITNLYHCSGIQCSFDYLRNMATEVKDEGWGILIFLVGNMIAAH